MLVFMISFYKDKMGKLKINIFKKSRGLSIVEALVTMVIFSMILVAFSSLSVGIDKVIDKVLGAKSNDSEESLSKELSLKCDDFLKDLRVDKKTGEVTSGSSITLAGFPELAALKKGAHKGYKVDKITLGKLEEGKYYGLLLDKNIDLNGETKETVMHLPLTIHITPNGKPPHKLEYQFKVVYDHRDSIENPVAFCSVSKVLAVKPCKEKNSILIFKNGILRCARPLKKAGEEDVKEADYLMTSKVDLTYFPCHPLRYSRPSVANDYTIDFENRYEGWNLDDTTNTWKYTSYDRFYKDLKGKEYDNRKVPKYNLFKGSPAKYKDGKYSYEYKFCPKNRLTPEAALSATPLSVEYTCLDKDIETYKYWIDKPRVGNFYGVSGDDFSIHRRERKIIDEEKEINDEEEPKDFEFSREVKPIPPSKILTPEGEGKPGGLDVIGYCATALLGANNEATASLVSPDTNTNFNNSNFGVKIFEGEIKSQSKGHIRIKTQVPVYHEGKMDSQINLSLFYKEGGCSLGVKDNLLRTSILLNSRRKARENNRRSDGHSSYLMATHPTEENKTYCYKLVARIIGKEFKVGNAIGDHPKTSIHAIFLGTILGDKGRFLSQGFIEFTHITGFKDE